MESRCQGDCEDLIAVVHQLQDALKPVSIGIMFHPAAWSLENNSATGIRLQGHLRPRGLDDFVGNEPMCLGRRIQFTIIIQEGDNRSRAGGREYRSPHRGIETVPGRFDRGSRQAGLAFGHCGSDRGKDKYLAREQGRLNNPVPSVSENHNEVVPWSFTRTNRESLLKNSEAEEWVVSSSYASQPYVHSFSSPTRDPT